MKLPLTVLVSLLLGPGLVTAQAQQMDLDAMARWSDAKVVHYKIVGAYQAQAVIAYQEDGGQATVTDRVLLEFDWDPGSEKLLGPVAIQNVKSEVKDLRNVERSCPPPLPKGDYEHIEVTGARDDGASGLQLSGKRSYPLIDVTAYCQGSWAKKTVPAKQETVTETVPVLAAMALAMPNSPDSPITVAPDRKSFAVKAGGWTWTYTPSIPGKGK